MRPLTRLILTIVPLSTAWTVVRPHGAAVWRSNQQAIVQWSPSEDDTADGMLFNVDLMLGPGNGVMVMEIDREIQAANGGVYWNVTSFLSTRSDYFVRLSAPGAANATAYAVSDRFKIVSPEMLAAPKVNNAGPVKLDGAKLAALLSILFLFGLCSQ